MTVFGIVGHAADKFTPETEELARKAIRYRAKKQIKNFAGEN